MAIAICSKCGSPVEIIEGEEWGYCPMCENDQVELKRNLKLSLENAVEFIPDKRNLDYSEEDDKEINNFVKGLLYKDFIEKSYKIDVLEKALELACKELIAAAGNENRITVLADEFSQFNRKNKGLTLLDYFKTKAKEMMKSE